ncbi:MAG TPA: hypothetical protein DCX28_14435 [Enterobacteriaceae bacterium]|nr:hypothetical protein [Enterobacteriaceae bacterium]
MSNPRHLGRKLDDSLPDFAGFVVRRFRKCCKSGKNRCLLWISYLLSIKKPGINRVFAPFVLRKQKQINVWRTEDDDVLYADRLSYVQPDERHE